VGAGRKVLLLLGPIQSGHCALEKELWSHAATALAFPDLRGVVYVANFDSTTNSSSRSLQQWRQAGEDDAIAVAARYASNGRLPPEVGDFLRDHRLDAVHVNHCFEMALGQRVADLAERTQGVRPIILLDTHDIQAACFRSSDKLNPHSRVLDELEALSRTELDLCRAADVLIHCAPKDLAYFQFELPEKRHAFLPPSIDPRTERRLVADRRSTESAVFDFLYVGNSNWPNFQSVEWFLDGVAPHLGDDARVAIVGSVRDLVRQHRPDLGERYSSILMGEVDALGDYYRRSSAIIAPAVAGTGTSIKLIEGLCAGKPMIATSHALRGLPSGASTKSSCRLRTSQRRSPLR
jgi:glycosyltransferase involved in cell wall biosynthesis